MPNTDPDVIAHDQLRAANVPGPRRSTKEARR
jgi:hypothetical protein